MTQVHHHLIMTDVPARDGTRCAIIGSCDCSAWFKILVGGDGEMLASVAFNNYPPCWATWCATREFEMELRDAAR